MQLLFELLAQTKQEEDLDHQEHWRIEDLRHVVHQRRAAAFKNVAEKLQNPADGKRGEKSGYRRRQRPKGDEVGKIKKDAGKDRDNKRDAAVEAPVVNE